MNGTTYYSRCDLKIVSDANLFFIETILKHLGLEDCFSEINTNPSFVDEEGRLRIFPHHDFTSSSHGCSLCPPNMCKVMENFHFTCSFNYWHVTYFWLISGFCSATEHGDKEDSGFYIHRKIDLPWRRKWRFLPEFETGSRRLCDAKEELPTVGLDLQKSQPHKGRDSWMEWWGRAGACSAAPNQENSRRKQS